MLKFIHRGHINNIPALVQIMAWRRPGNKPLSEPMIDSLPAIYVSLSLNELSWNILVSATAELNYQLLYTWSKMFGRIKCFSGCCLQHDHGHQGPHLTRDFSPEHSLHYISK